MLTVTRACRVTANKNQLVRCISTQYVPGRKGYAPGFKAPEGTREDIKISNKRQNIAHSLSSHLGNAEQKVAEETNSPKKLYQQQLKATRLQYARELLEKQGQRDLVSAEKLALAEEKTAQLKEYFNKEKLQQKEHEKEVSQLLSMEMKSANNDTKPREQQRIENRLAHEEAQRNVRRKQLLKLYSATEDFVTLDNLDAKIDAVLSREGRSFHESLNELRQKSTSLHTEIEKRKMEIKEVMGL
ncbi:hypothetical protein BDB01DRAFT_769955 [Pilobolus umbonatus]|nr:hypothetical protein BDB01DRAFT_769955 [Pilobolus umbonatus]